MQKKISARRRAAIEKYRLARHADDLTSEQLVKLCYWQQSEVRAWFQREHPTAPRRWQELNLRGLLKLYNASCEYDSLQGWADDIETAGQELASIWHDPRNYYLMD